MTQSLTQKLLAESTSFLKTMANFQLPECDEQKWAWCESYLGLVHPSLKHMFAFSPFFASRPEQTDDRPALEQKQSVFQDLTTLYIKYLQQRIPNSLRLWVLYEVAFRNPLYVDPHSLHVMILRQALTTQPITTICILKHLFNAYPPSVIISWALELVDESTLPEDYVDVLKRYQYSTCWTHMHIAYDSHLYSAIIGNLVWEEKLENIEEYLLCRLNKFLFVIIRYEAAQKHKLDKMFQLNDPAEDTEAAKFDLLRIGHDARDLPVWEPPSERHTFTWQRTETVKTYYMNETEELMKKVLNQNRSCQYKACDAILSDNDINIYKQLVSTLSTSYWSSIWEQFDVEPFFTLFSTFASLDLLVLSWIKFFREEILCINASEMWNGSAWVAAISTAPLANNVRSYAQINIRGRPTIPIPPNRQQLLQLNYYACKYDNGLCFYCVLNVYETSSPALPGVTRKLRSVLLPDAILYSPRLPAFRKHITHQLKYIIYFHAMLDVGCAVTNVLYLPWTRLAEPVEGDSSESLMNDADAHFVEVNEAHYPAPINKNIWLESWTLMPDTVIEKMLALLQKEAPAMVSLLCNLALQITPQLLNFSTFEKLLFDSDSFFASSLGQARDFVVIDNQENETTGDVGNFTSSVIEISAKLQSLLDAAPQVTLEMKQVAEKIRERVVETIWRTPHTNKRLSRMKVLEMIQNFEPKSPFDIGSLPSATSRQVVIILVALIRGRTKTIPPDHPAHNTVLHKYLQLSRPLERLRKHFPEVYFEFESTSERITAYLEFLNYSNQHKLMAHKPLAIYPFTEYIATALFWKYHLCNFSLANFTTQFGYDVSCEMEGNFLRRVVYMYGSSTCGKTQQSQILNKIYDTGEANALTAQTFKSEENELNNASLPLHNNLVAFLDEFKTFDSTQLNKIVSETPQSSRIMKTQQFKTVITRAKVFLFNNVKAEFTSNQGVETRLIAMWIKHHFEQSTKAMSWSYHLPPKGAPRSWGVQRVMHVYGIGIDSPAVVRGYFLVLRHFGSKLYSPKSVVDIIISPEYQAMTQQLLESTDPYAQYVKYWEEEKAHLQSMTTNQAIEYIMAKHKIKWSQPNINLIKQRLEENRLLSK